MSNTGEYTPKVPVANDEPKVPVTNKEPQVLVTNDGPPKVTWYREACVEAVVEHKAALVSKTQTAGSYALKAVVVRSDRLWENGSTLTFGFIDQAPLTPYQTNQQAKVRKVITEWQKYANITFSYTEDIKSATIRIQFDPAGGSWSFVGKEVLLIKDSEKPTMNLGWIDGSSDVVSDNENGVILHEFGHTLGLMHEHQSPLRGKKITLKESAVINFYTQTQGWSEQEVREQIINVYNAQDVSNYSEIDLTSIMQYFMPPEMNEQNIRVTPNNKLSDTDKAFMIINYPPFVPAFVDVKEGKSDPSLRAKFEAALNDVGVNADSKALILKFYDAQNWTEVRYEFTRFCTETRIARQAASTDSPSVPSYSATPIVIPDGCLAEDREDVRGSQKGVATVDADLWLPGDEITYSWVQGSLDATEHRKKKVKETFAVYTDHANLTFKEIPFDPKKLTAKVHFYFGNIPVSGATGWCKIGKQGVGYRQTQALIDERGGSVESSIVLSDLGVPKDASSDDDVIRREKRTYFHEIGHMLGLKHEHVSPNTLTTDKPDLNVSTATLFDDTSVMLYADRKFREGANFPALKDYFDPTSTKFNHEPSKLDLAFLGALYPNRSGHVDDHLVSDLKALGLAANLTALTTLRDSAYSVEHHPEFIDRISKYREALRAKLAALVPNANIIAAHSAFPPSNFKAARDAAVAPPSQATTGSFVDELVKTLQAIFKPTTGQLFALQFPGRFLQQDLYAWDTTSAGIYGQFSKPTVVNESEFRLVDQLYNVGSVIGAPNGLNLSIVYEQCLNNLIPGVGKSAVKFAKQQSKIRQWLLKDVPTSGWVKDLLSSQHSQAMKSTTPGPVDSGKALKASSAINPDAKPQFAVAQRLSDDTQVNRMELADALMQEYLSAKQAWELERDEMIKNANGKDLDALTRRLAHITAIREAQLASKHADAVVRGYSHAIRQYLGFLDVKTPAEILQDAKDALRESAMSSLDGSMKVYPVQLSPVDWFQSLSTSFTMEDLTVDVDVIAQQLDAKSRQLDLLNTRLATIQSKPKTDVNALQAKLDSAQLAYDKAQSDLTATYTTNVISLAKTFVDANYKFQADDFVKGAKAARIADAAFENIETGMQQLATAQLSVTQNSRALTLLMSQKSLAEASDTTQEVIEVQVQITALTKDIAELTARLQALRYKPSPAPAVTDPSKPPSVKDVDMHPPASSAGGSRWQDIYMKHSVANKYTVSSDRTHAAASKSDASLFFGSYHSESSESSSSSTGSGASKSVEVEVGFRATMVTVDRGGWFQPQFFKQSTGFHSIDKNITWSRWPDNIKTVQELTNNNGEAFTELNKHLLPAFPVGFVVCKDITIRIHMDSADIKSEGAEMEKFAASSAGVLCWSTSSSEHDKSSDKSHSFAQKSDGCVIRIPGPQILGYMLQFTDKDESSEIPDELPEGFLMSDDDYNSSFSAKPATSHAVDPNAANSPPSGPTSRAVDPNSANPPPSGPTSRAADPTAANTPPTGPTSRAIDPNAANPPPTGPTSRAIDPNAANPPPSLPVSKA